MTLTDKPTLLPQPSSIPTCQFPHAKDIKLSTISKNDLKMLPVQLKINKCKRKRIKKKNQKVVSDQSAQVSNYTSYAVDSDTEINRKEIKKEDKSHGLINFDECEYVPTSSEFDVNYLPTDLDDDYVPKKSKSKSTSKNSNVKYKCTVESCTKVYSRKDHLNAHIKTHDPSNHFKYNGIHNLKCDFRDCKLQFKKRKKLYLHKCKHENVLPYNCTFSECGKRFATPAKLADHINTHSIKTKYVCSLPNCQEKFVKWNDYQKHLRLGSHRFECQFCLKVFDKKTKLKNHFLTHIKDTGDKDLENYPFPLIERVKCTYQGCKSSFRKKGNLMTHIKTAHLNKHLYHCDIEDCRMIFNLKGALTRHRLTVHRCTTPSSIPPTPVPSIHSIDTNITDTDVQSSTGSEGFNFIPDDEINPLEGKDFMEKELGNESDEKVIDDAGNFSDEMDKQFKCDVLNCGKRYINLSSLYRHKKHKHQIN